MNRENETKERQPTPDHATPSSITQEDSPSPPTVATNEQLKAAESKLEKRMSDFERSTIWLTRLAIGVAVVAAIFNCLQWLAMRETLDEMKASGNTSTNQFWQAIGNMNWLAKTMDGTLKLSSNAMEESKIQNTATLKANIIASRLDQRAWVGVPEFVTTGGSQSSDGKIFSFSELLIVIRNSGKTPALNLTAATLVLSKDSLEKIGDYDAEIAKISAKISGHSQVDKGFRGDLFPAQQVLSPGAAINQIASQGGQWTIRDDVNNRFFIPYVFGKITYNDIFSRKKHTTEFCFERNFGSNFVPCFHGNWMD